MINDISFDSVKILIIKLTINLSEMKYLNSNYLEHMLAQYILNYSCM